MRNVPAAIYRKTDLGVTGQVCKNAPGAILSYHFINVGSGARFVKVYDKATAPTQADTPVMTIPLAATSNAAFSSDWPLPFAAGISFRATTGLADNDTGAPTAGDVTINVVYA